MRKLQLITTILIVFIGLLTAQKVSAAVFTVTNTNDSGAGSLRQAILNANVNNDDDEINFDSNIFGTAQTITLTSGELTVGSDNASGNTRYLKINGSGANLLTISGNNQSRVFTIARFAKAFIDGVKITKGNGVTSSEHFRNSGGGITVEGGSFDDGSQQLTLSNSIVTDNNVGAYGGGGITLQGQVTIVNSTISNNVSGYGGGIAVSNSSVLRIYNSTISYNSAGGSLGGGIASTGNALYLTNCTVAFNDANFGGGIYLESQTYGTILHPKNTILADNFTTSGNAVDISGDVYSEGYNIFGSAAGANIRPNSNLAGNLLNIDPQLDPVLKVNGGILPTHAISAGSPAIDRGDNCVLISGCSEKPITADQRGVARPQDGDNDGTATVDIGAFEITQGEVMSSPNIPDLRAADDSGISNSDNITSNKNLTFDITRINSGGIVEFFRNGIKIGEKTAEGTNVTFTDNLSSDGSFIYTARQTVNNTTGILSGSLTVTVDTVAPALTINQAAGQTDPTKDQIINFSAVFSEAVAGFSASNISLNGSTAGVAGAVVAISGSGANYNVAISGITSDGIVNVFVPANAVRDLAGNSSAAATFTDNNVTIDRTPPTVTINQASGQADPARSPSINFTVVFSEPVSGFTNADISLAGSTANVLNAIITVTGSGATYNVNINGLASNGDYIQASVISQAAVDSAGNLSFASTSIDNRVVLDNTSPNAAINQSAAQSDPTSILPVNFTVVFTEPVTGFDSADILLTVSGVNISAAVITVTGSGANYNVAVSNITSNGGFIRASIRNGAVTDAVGNTNFGSTSTDNTVVIDNVAPSVSINQAIGQNDPAIAQPLNFTVVFSENVSGFTSSDVSLNGSTANISSAVISVSGSGNVYVVKISNILSSGVVRTTIPGGAAQDSSGNLSLASTSGDNIVTFILVRPVTDFDADGKADFSVYRPSNNFWYFQQTTAGFSAVGFGQSGDKLVPADFDGDGKTDLAVYRPSSGDWIIRRSLDGQTYTVNFGAAEDIPVPADFDGDGKADINLFRPSNGVWYRLNSSNGAFVANNWGTSGDKPAIGDFDGDGKADLAVYRPSNGVWYIVNSSTNNYTIIGFGAAEDLITPGDYDGDGKTDIAVFRPSTNIWYRLNSSTGAFAAVAWGAAGDKPVPADYDGDGRTDIAVYRNGTWYIIQSANGQIGYGNFGDATDVPLPNVYVR